MGAEPRYCCYCGELVVNEYRRVGRTRKPVAISRCKKCKRQLKFSETVAKKT